jgi:bla regulator protein BlaR1
MEYIGGGQWQGALAGTQFTVQVGSRDVVDLPFVNDPSVIGAWKTVDFVANISDFNPARPGWAEDKLFLKGLTFLENGQMPEKWWTWTKGVVIHHGDKTASLYEIKEISGHTYLFFEWKSGDVTTGGMKPHYYVLTK